MNQCCRRAWRCRAFLQMSQTGDIRSFYARPGWRSDSLDHRPRQVRSSRMSSMELGPYADPTKFHGDLDITGWQQADLLAFLESMLRIRAAERKLAQGRKDGVIGGPVHLGVGQEAVAVGVSHSLRH